MKDSVFFNMNLALSQAMSISVRVSTVSLRCLLQDSAGDKREQGKRAKAFGKGSNLYSFFIELAT